MIIDSLAFFLLIFIFLLVCGIIGWGDRRRKKRYQTEENVSASLSFPQRHWFILCLIVAIISPIAVSAIQTMTRKEAYKQSTEQSVGNTGSGDTTAKDTSYHVAAPPSH